MSRYFELMRASEREQIAQSRVGGEPVLPLPVEDSFETGLQWTGTTQSLAILPRSHWRRPEVAPESFLRFLVESCFRHPRSFLGIAGAGLLLTVLAILTTPKRYEATMQMMVLHGGAYAGSGGDASDRAADGDMTKADANAQAELLRGRDSLGQALDQRGAPASTALARDEAIDALGRNLKVTPVPGSNLLQLSYRDYSPQAASDMLQAVAASFVSREVGLLRPSRQQALADLVDKRQRELTAAQQDVASFAGTTGIASLGEVESGAADPWQARAAGAQRNLALATQKRNQDVVDDAAEKDRVRSAVIAAQPTASSIPVQPRPVLYGLFGLACAMFLAVGFCALAERKRTTIYSPGELEALMGVTTLATVPMQKS